MSDFNMRGVTLKKLTVRDTFDGYSFSADLYIDGKRIFTARNFGNGSSDERRYAPGMTEDKAYELIAARWDAEEAGLKNYRSPGLIDMFTAAAIDQHEADKKAKRMCRKKTLVITTDCAEGCVIVYNYPYTPEVANYMRTVRHKNDLVEIVNERYQ